MGTGGSSAGGAGGLGAAGGTGGSNAGGAGGLGAGGSGSGGSGGSFCAPLSSQPCYTGPAGTEGVGLCKGGLQMCAADGSSFGPCEGEQLPSPELCGTSGDDDCDGDVNEEGADCVCTPGSTLSCYSGPAATLGVGMCIGGTQTCNAAGTGYLPCASEVTPQPESCATLADEDCDAEAECAGDTVWAKRFGGAGSEGGLAIAVDWTDVSLLFGSQASTFGVRRLDGNGEQQWSKFFGGFNQIVTARSIATSMGTTVITGDYAGAVDFGGGPLPPGGVFVASFDPGGQHLWSVAGTGSIASARATGVSIAEPGDAYVTGYFSQTIGFEGGPLTSSGSWDVYVAKLASWSGDVIWAKRYGDGDFQKAGGIAVGPFANVVIAGAFGGTIDFGGGSMASAGNFDIYLASLSPNGDQLWAKRFGNNLAQEALAIAVGFDGIVITGSVQGAVDFGGGLLTGGFGQDVFVAKFDSSGAHVFSKVFAGADAQDEGRSISVDDGGNIYLAGRAPGVDFGGGSLQGPLFAVKLDALGNHLWSRSYATEVSAIAAFPQTGHAAVTGSFTGTVDFGGVTLVSAGSSDVAVAKLFP